MNDLRRGLLWLALIASLMVAIWGFQWDEECRARPFSIRECRGFRLANQVDLFGHPFYLPWRRMLCGWGAILCAAGTLWPLATHERSRRYLGRWERPLMTGHPPRRLPFLLALTLAAAIVDLPASAAAAPPDRPEPEAAAEPLREEQARRLFLDFIRDSKNVIPNCLFVGGGQVKAISPNGEFATARIRYTLQCVQEEIPTAPLNRSLTEDFIYRNSGGQWAILGRAFELSPSMKGEEKSVPSKSPAPTLLPADADRKAIAEVIVAWVGMDRRPSGVGETYPGADSFGGRSAILVSNENLGGVPALDVPGREVRILSPEALLQWTSLAEKGNWIRFDALEIGKQTARAQVSLVASGPPTRILSRILASFSRGGKGWRLVRYQQQAVTPE